MHRSLPAALFLAIASGTASAQPAPAPAPTPDAEPAPPPAEAADADMAAAADATADVAAMPADEAAPPAEAPPGDDIDLASLGLDPEGSAFDDKLNIYGFADVGWAWTVFTEDSPFLADSREFAFGNLNLYFAKNLLPKWRAMAEVRFLFAPNGSQNADGSYTSGTAQDPGNFNRPIQWGGVSIERGYVEYDAHELVTIRAGRFLTPYGIWNIDHGSPAIIATIRPYVIGEQYFPERQTGIEVFGAKYLGEIRVGYHATASNGRGNTDAFEDRDLKMAFGGRLTLDLPIAGSIKIGGSIYGGRASFLPPNVMTPAVEYDELSYGVDAQWDLGGLHVQGEFIGRERDYVEGHGSADPFGRVTEGRDIGFYGLVGYRTQRFWNVMPYAFFERNSPLDTSLYVHLTAANAGLNFRPGPSLVLKVNAGHAWFSDQGGLLGGNGINIVSTQAAWMF
jgi:hypothetical protein